MTNFVSKSIMLWLALSLSFLVNAEQRNTSLEWSNLPSNSGGISITTINLAESGEVVPVTLTPGLPLMPGDKLILTADGEEAMQLSTDNNPITGVSTRLRLGSGEIGAFIVRSDGVIHSKSQKIKVLKPAKAIPLTGKGGFQHQVQVYKVNSVRMKFQNDMAQSNYLRKVVISSSRGGNFFAKFSPKLSKDPFLAIGAKNALGSVIISN